MSLQKCWGDPRGS